MKKLYIEYRERDEEVISFIHVSDLCFLIYEVIRLKIYGCINITTNSFESKFNLKAG